jgi:DNA-binding transcriptional ArsR family regulator
MDELPLEQEHYQDDGCDLFPSCLHCPLTHCRYDDPGRQTGKELRNAEMARLRQAGVSVRELAERFGVSRRTVYRTIAPRSDRGSYE